MLREKDKVPKTRVKQEHYILQAKEHLREASLSELSTPFPPGKLLLNLQVLFRCKLSGEVFPRSSSICHPFA